ncbi:SDR family NAD(P)-dependent oxidoreductase [Gillisia limnaea]|uniref:Short-chain dehydrogenase/reductase SDR n=1 Tax=Gillisia limnaea (strain DSM 15749 / LMG 21470 / R-8282) TaxID=865937 RepID=H2BYX7_GILLR|nr:SDR family oxidoreductase [Gillisia limnaea]EHQ02279.1 short-chain dehydrogenase/reductase SDR [Gillisia limnaea DSM 15749]
MKHIVITGASRGIGLEMVKLFTNTGHKVLALSRNIQPVQELELENVTALSCDITKEDSLQEVYGFVQSKWKRVDVLVNNAGAILNKPFKESSMEEFKRIYDTNVFGVVGLIQKLLPFMDKAGHVVNISSMGGVQGSMKFPGLSAYSSSKGALISLTEMLAEEYKEDGPSFNVLALGAVQTEMLEEAFPGYNAPIKAEEMAQYIVDFSLTANKYYNGKLLQVSNSTP